MESSVRIVHMTSAHPPFDTRIFFHECRSLVGRFDVVLIAPEPGTDERDGVRLVGVPRGRTRRQRWFRAVPRVLVAALRERPAIYHFHDPELLPVAVVLRLFGQRVVFDVHEHFSEIANTVLPPRLRRIGRLFVVLAVERLPRLVCHRIVYTTQALMEAVGAPPDRSVVVRNVPALREFPLTNVTAPEKDFDVVFLGTVSPYRMRVMLDVAARVKDEFPEVRWLFLGIPDGTLAWVRREYAGSAILPHVELMGRMDFAEVVTYLPRAKVGFNYHPVERRFEVVLPNKVLEYMAAELPVVTSHFSELALLTEPSELVMIENRSAAAHAEAVCRLLADPEQSAAIGAAARRAVVERINWEAGEEPKLWALYEALGATPLRVAA
jgi:glycosyltransferase involved in cell wall biosynthesis